ncbi:MAG: Ig-like domain-containing protein, partial [Spirochaetota bacterium]
MGAFFSNKKQEAGKKAAAVLFTAFCAFLFSCSGSSPVVLPAEVTTDNPTSESGNMLPQIQTVTPGTLQSLSVPYAVPAGISPNAPGITIIFSSEMQNASGEMAMALQLLDSASSPVAYTLNQYNPSVSSHAFTIVPVASLGENTTYTLRIWNICYETGH